jgi:hypothetical protein
MDAPPVKSMKNSSKPFATRTSRNQKAFIAHESGTPTEMKNFFRDSSFSVGENFFELKPRKHVQ